MKKIFLTILIAIVIFPALVHGDINSNLICYYTFDEGSGTSAADSAGNCGAGTLTGTNAPTWFTPGKIGAAGINNTDGTGGNGGYVMPANNTGITGTQSDWSFATWINPSDLTGELNHNIFMGGDVSNFWLEVNSDGTLLYLDVSGSSLTSSAGAITTNTWHHVVLTCKDDFPTINRATLYINGSQVAQQTGLTGGSAWCYNTNGLPMKLSWAGISLYAGSYGFTGKVDDSRIYSRELSSSDVVELYAYPPIAVATTKSFSILSGKLFSVFTGRTFILKR